MRKNTSVQLLEMQFNAFSLQGNGGSKRLSDLTYNRRHDFGSGDGNSKLAARLNLYIEDENGEDPQRGVSRKVTVSMIDCLRRSEVAKQTLNVVLNAKNGFARDYYLEFPVPEISSMLWPEIDYKFVVREEKSGRYIGEDVVHFYNESVLGASDQWYVPQRAALNKEQTSIYFRSINTDDIDTCELRYYFVLKHNFGDNTPNILPQLRVRLTSLDGDSEEVRYSPFAEPVCIDSDEGLYAVTMPLIMPYDDSGTSYYAELQCMNKPVAGMVFRTDKEVNGLWCGEHLQPITPLDECKAYDRLDDVENEEDMDFDTLLETFISKELQKQSAADCEEEIADLEEAYEEEEPDEQPGNESLLASLDSLVGLHHVKEKLTSYERMVRFNKMRTDSGLPVISTPLHAMFLGSPGTGKTTVAKMMGDMLQRAGMLSKGHVVVRERANLLGQNYHSESEKTLQAIEEAKGGILLIDEAYQLYQPNDPRDPGKFVIDTLLTALADEENRDWMLILAGYPKQTMRMLEMNPGLQSRIPKSNIYTFDDFSEKELMEIAEKYLTGQQFTLAPEAHTALEARLRSDYNQRDHNFGNARHVINLIQTQIIPAMAMRVTDGGSLDENSLVEIVAADIPCAEIGISTVRKRVGFAV